MSKIWKYGIPIEDEFTINLPIGSHTLCVQNQYNAPNIWVRVPDKVSIGYEKRSFFIFGTGHPIDDSIPMRYIGTFQQFEGQLVWHLFERE